MQKQDKLLVPNLVYLWKHVGRRKANIIASMGVATQGISIFCKLIGMWLFWSYMYKGARILFGKRYLKGLWWRGKKKLVHFLLSSTYFPRASPWLDMNRCNLCLHSLRCLITHPNWNDYVRWGIVEYLHHVVLTNIEKVILVSIYLFIYLCWWSHYNW
jgi:hypothetical protein